MRQASGICTFVAIVLMTFVACSGDSDPDRAEPRGAPEAPRVAEAEPPRSQPEPAVAPEPLIAESEVHEVAPTTAPVPTPEPTPVPPKLIEVAATKAGLTRIGDGKCKICHKVQYQSWSDSPHAALDPPLGCESCHGAGSEYKALAIMKDPALAAAAGLVTPESTFCTEHCHGENWQEDMLARSHAHTLTRSHAHKQD
jgi:hypothetical protein